MKPFTRALALSVLALAVRQSAAAITIQFDYTYDSTGFFSGANIGRRDLLAEAAANLTSRMTNEHFSAVIPSDPNTWSLQFFNPSTGGQVSLTNPTIPADTLTVFVGAQNLGGALGLGGSGGFSAGGTSDWINLLESKNTTTHFEPLDGAISFDSSTNWYFGADPSGLAFTQYDFFSVVQHELGHIFGFTSDDNAFAAQTSITGMFLGPRSTALYGGPIPLGPDQSHWAPGVISPPDQQEVAMDPSITNGQRKNFTELDFAALQDVGYQISPVAGWVNLGAGSRHFTATEIVGNITGTPASSVLIDPAVTITSLSVNIGTLQINGTHVIQPNTSLTGRTSTVGMLTLAGSPGAWTGLLDLTNNNLIVSSGNVASQIKQAANLGAWNGIGGITSSAAAAAAASSTATALAYATGAEYTTATGNVMFDSLPFNPTDTLIMYTLAGDSNMDGSVTFADFLALQNNYNKPGDWAQGDWNYDGQVTFADFLILQNNYNKTLTVSNVQPALGVAAAPEPSALVLLGTGLLALAAGRRRR